MEIWEGTQRKMIFDWRDQLLHSFAMLFAENTNVFMLFYCTLGFLNHQQNNHNGHIQRNGSQNCTQYKITRSSCCIGLQVGKQ